MLTNSKTIYTDWHKQFPNSGQGKQYPYLLDKILQNHRLHKRVVRSGRKRNRWNTLLDYGCGKGGTAQWLHTLVKDVEIDLYDPGNPQYANTKLQEQYDLVYSCDVFEHIELEDIHTVIQQCQSLASANIHIIDMTPAKKRLPDGRNAHVTLLNTHQWIETFERHSHTIEEVMPYSVEDKRFGTRDRVCICTHK